jgi:hypothetical protein
VEFFIQLLERNGKEIHLEHEKDIDWDANAAQ